MSKKNDVSPLNFSEPLFYAFVKAVKLYIGASNLNPVVNGLHSKKWTSMSVYLPHINKLNEVMSCGKIQCIISSVFFIAINYNYFHENSCMQILRC